MATILLVDDNADNLDIYEVMLTHAGYTVLVASDGEAAVRAVREHRPDLVFMDATMPVMDGLEATRILKADPTTASVCIVVLTAHALEGDRERMLGTGCDGYLSKPIEPRALLVEARRLLATAD